MLLISRAISLLSMTPMAVISYRCHRFFLISIIPALSPAWAILPASAKISMQANWLCKGRAARALFEFSTKGKLRNRLRTESCCYNTEPPCLSEQTNVPTASSYHLVQRQPKTRLKLPECVDFIPKPGPEDQDAEGNLQWQLEKATRASLSFTKERV